MRPVMRKKGANEWALINARQVFFLGVSTRMVGLRIDFHI
jgi:hypothetical protein